MTVSHYDPLKRAIDVVVGGVVMLLSLPVQAVVAMLVRIKLGSPVLFRQQRPGKDARLFELVKFRTMLPVDADRDLVSDADRLTGFGAFLRSTSLDELPTLWNVVKGDMSLVGPRPLLVAYLPLYSSEQARRHEVRPGVTGLAQVSGRNALSWHEKFEADVRYVDGRSLALDLWILMRTAANVVRGTGVLQPTELETPYFEGNQ